MYVCVCHQDWFQLVTSLPEAKFLRSRAVCLEVAAAVEDDARLGLAVVVAVAVCYVLCVLYVCCEASWRLTLVLLFKCFCQATCLIS